MTAAHPTILRIDAAGVCDAHAQFSPGALLLEQIPDGLLLLAAGHPADVDRHPAARDARRIDRPDLVLLPGLVNAHTHLDLTHVGPHPAGGSFDSFIDLVRAHRREDSTGITASVRTGIDCSLRGGVVAVGDIAGCPRTGPTLTPGECLDRSLIRGVSFLEFFSIGASGRRGLDAAERQAARARFGSVRFGFEPHAPYSVSGAAYGALASRSEPLCTHLAETAAEVELIARGTGPFRMFLERLGLWDDSCAMDFGQGKTPVAHVLDALGGRGLLAAHVNHATDDDILRLASTGSAVAYCPRSSAYFGAPGSLGPHRYRAMLEAGVTVALGTDSIINLDTPDRISTLDEMRLLYRRDKTDPALLLAMATTHGARSLGLDARRFVFEPGQRPMGVIGVRAGPGDSLEAVMRGDGGVELRIPGGIADDSGQERT